MSNFVNCSGHPYTEGVQHAVTCSCDVPFADLDDLDFTYPMLLVDAFEYTLQIPETDSRTFLSLSKSCTRGPHP